MSSVDIIKTLTKGENIMAVYRNYNSLKTRSKRLVKLRMVTEIPLIIAMFMYLSLTRLISFTEAGLNIFNYVFVIYYLTFEALNSFLAITLSCSRSKYFEEFVSHIDSFQQLFNADSSYRNFTKTRYKRFNVDCAVVTIAVMAVTIVYFLEDFPVVAISELAIVYFMTGTVHQWRFFYENYVFFEFVEIIIGQLRFLNGSVREAVNKLNDESVEVENYRDLLVTEVRDELVKWGDGSQLLVAASDRLRDCFGLQIAISLCSVTVYYIMLLYAGVSYLASADRTSTLIQGTMCSLVSYTVTKILVVTAGQRAQDQADLLSQNLANLHNLLVGSAEAAACARAAAGLARRLRAAPLRVRLLSSLAVQMALLADILAVVANYTILMLQFNHVV